ncbi:MAG TPA: glucosaminidase domain-containing protein [Puia sp.]|nr:glucosaminidase domain-containing protein [Puia sp.]
MNIKSMAFLLSFAAGTSLRAQNSVDVINYINTYKGIAMSEMQRSGVPASIILAQGIHETEAGTSDLVRRSNNHFGIKCKEEWTGAVVYHDDDSRGECFRSYPTPQDSYRDHSDFLRNGTRYAFLFKLDGDDFEGWANGLRKAGYATNIKYSQILIKLVKEYNLQQYSLIAMGKMKSSEEIVLQVPGQPANGSSVTILSEPEKDPLYRATTVATDRPPGPAYPEGEFTINNTRVIFVRSGTSLLSVADQYDLPLARLLDFNDIKEEDVLVRDQLLFLQRKRRTGPTEFHIVREGESLYDISQSEGLRYEDMLQMNQLKDGDQPAIGEKIWLKASAPSRPLLAGTVPKPAASQNYKDQH